MGRENDKLKPSIGLVGRGTWQSFSLQMKEAPDGVLVGKLRQATKAPLRRWSIATRPRHNQNAYQRRDIHDPGSLTKPLRAHD